jgi:hypothetical protein
MQDQRHKNSWRREGPLVAFLSTPGPQSMRSSGISACENTPIRYDSLLVSYIVYALSVHILLLVTWSNRGEMLESPS